jgi:type III secretion protein L
VSKKFFSLIQGSQLHIAPKVKVVSAEAISTLQNAEEVLIAVKNDADQYKREIIAEVEALKEQAQQEGFEAGFQEWVEKIAALEEEVHKVRQDMEKRVVPVVLKAARKIVHREIESHPEVILDIVLANLKAVAQHKKIALYVNKNDLALLEANKAQLRELFEHLEVLSIRERADVEAGGCVIETEGGIINAKLSSRLAALDTAMETLMKTQG